MSGVFQNIDPPPPTPSHALRVCTPRLGAGRGHTRWVERGWGVNSKVWKTPDTALYSPYEILCGTMHFISIMSNFKGRFPKTIGIQKSGLKERIVAR
jgi:hypothetical protein